MLAVLAFLALRAIVNISVRHLLERRAAESGDGVLPEAELERRVRTVGQLIVKIAAAVILVIAILMALDLFGIDIGPAIAGLGVVGIAVGLGAQTLVRDWLAGIFIVLEAESIEAGIDALFASVGSRARVLIGLRNQFYGMREFTIEDPDGYVVTFAQRIG